MRARWISVTMGVLSMLNVDGCGNRPLNGDFLLTDIDLSYERADILDFQRAYNLPRSFLPER